jgi:hypothetical protein
MGRRDPIHQAHPAEFKGRYRPLGYFYLICSLRQAIQPKSARSAHLGPGARRGTTMADIDNKPWRVMEHSDSSQRRRRHAPAASHPVGDSPALTSVSALTSPHRRVATWDLPPAIGDSNDSSALAARFSRDVWRCRSTASFGALWCAKTQSATRSLIGESLAGIARMAEMPRGPPGSAEARASDNTDNSPEARSFRGHTFTPAMPASATTWQRDGNGPTSSCS